MSRLFAWYQEQYLHIFVYMYKVCRRPLTLHVIYHRIQIVCHGSLLYICPRPEHVQFVNSFLEVVVLVG